MAQKPKSGIKINREIKSRVFAMLLEDNPAAAISAANTFAGTHYGPDTKVEFKTIENSLTKGRVNDVSFLLDDRLIVFIEHQSTICNAMPYRMLQYIAETYRGLNDIKKEYSERGFPLQRPKFIVLYNGPSEMPDGKQLLRLSDMFIPAGPRDAPDDGIIDLELTVTMYNINHGHNENLVRGCETIREYSIFINIIREHRKAMPLEEAVQKAVIDCIGQGVLKEFLSKNKQKVVNMLISEWNMDIALEVRGEEERMEEKREIAKKLRVNGVDVDTIAKSTGLTVDDILKLDN